MSNPDYRALAPYGKTPEDARLDRAAEAGKTAADTSFEAVLSAQPPATLAQPDPVARPEDEYHEDMGAVLWWRFPIDEPPYCGSPLDSEWPGCHTHFTPLGPMPIPANNTKEENLDG
jgi:hypothetical protein